MHDAQDFIKHFSPPISASSTPQVHPPTNNPITLFKVNLTVDPYKPTEVDFGVKL